MCRVYFELDLWPQWERSLQKSSSASHASEGELLIGASPPLLIPPQSHSSVPNTAHLCFGSRWNKCITPVDLATMLRALYEASGRARCAGTAGVEHSFCIWALRLQRSFLLSWHSWRIFFFFLHLMSLMFSSYDDISRETLVKVLKSQLPLRVDTGVKTGKPVWGWQVIHMKYQGRRLLCEPVEQKTYMLILLQVRCVWQVIVNT